jgi:toxin-antitoxin system PIN domain toxin
MRTSRRALLDVNVLIALFDAGHVHHEIAHDWFSDQQTSGWATCPLTENGFLRIVMNPRGPVREDRVTVFASLNALCSSEHHEFWPDTVSLRDDTLFDPQVHVSYLQLADVYLLGLAVRTGGTLATFDAGIPWRAVRGATRASLTVIAPA